MNIGDAFGRLTVIGYKDEKKRYCNVKCICGTIKDVRIDHLLRGETKSCGCLSIEKAKERLIKHGLSGTTEYKTWSCMLHRCNNPKDKRYCDYGGRGISVCDRWNFFENFLHDMGKKPFRGAQIDRKDNNGDYNKPNCRWASRKKNQRNMRSNRIITYNGESNLLIFFAEKHNINPSTLRKRISRGWTVKRAIETNAKKGVKP